MGLFPPFPTIGHNTNPMACPGDGWHPVTVSTPRPGDVSPGGTRHYDSDAWGWQNLWLTASDVRAIAAAEFGASVTGPVELLGEGLLNQSWRLPCADHDRVLRVGRLERSADQVHYEREIALAWAADVPEMIVAESDRVPVVDGHALTLFPFVSGRSGVQVDPLARSRALVPIVARMHRLSLERGLPQRPGFHAIDERPRWFGWPRAREAIMERYGTGSDVIEPITIVDRATAELDGLLDRWQSSGRLATRATVHGDLNPRNLLFDDTALSGVLDTDDCRVEPLIWDVANLAYGSPELDPHQVWLAYREAGGPLPDEDEEMLVHFARIGALTAIIWLTDGEPGQEQAATHLALDNLRELAGNLSGDVVRRD